MKTWLTPYTIAIIAILAAASTGAANADTTKTATQTASLPSTSASVAPAGLPVGPPGVAASVDGYNIMFSDVERLAYAQESDQAFNELVDDIVVTTEAKKHNIVAPDEDVEDRVNELRETYKPESLESVISRHHSTMQELRDGLRRHVLLQLMAADGAPKPPMAHVREIVISVPPGTDADAKAKLTKAIGEFKAGKKFEDLVEQYSTDTVTKAKGGDAGFWYDGIQLWQPVNDDELKAALAMKSGEISQEPVKDFAGWAVLEAVSTGADHPASENHEYDHTQRKWQEAQGAPHEDVLAAALHEQAKIVDYLKTSADGKNGIAAVVDGQNVTVAAVHARALELARTELLSRLIDMRLTETQAQKENLVVTDADVEFVKSNLRQHVAPMSLEDYIKQQHMSMATLNDKLKFLITLNRLAGEKSMAPKMYHVRRLFISAPKSTAPAPAASPYQSAAATDPASAKAIATMEQVEAQLQGGAKFEDLVKQYSEDKDTKDKGGDMGLIYGGIQPPVDADVIAAAENLKPGEVTPSPVRSADGYNLVQLVSTSDDHPASENQDYIDAAWHYKETQGSMVADTYMQQLHHSAKIVVYSMQ